MRVWQGYLEGVARLSGGCEQAFRGVGRMSGGVGRLSGWCGKAVQQVVSRNI